MSRHIPKQPDSSKSDKTRNISKSGKPNKSGACQTHVPASHSPLSPNAFASCARRPSEKLIRQMEKTCEKWCLSSNNGHNLNGHGQLNNKQASHGEQNLNNKQVTKNRHLPENGGTVNYAPASENKRAQTNQCVLNDKRRTLTGCKEGAPQNGTNANTKVNAQKNHVDLSGCEYFHNNAVQPESFTCANIHNRTRNKKHGFCENVHNSHRNRLTGRRKTLNCSHSNCAAQDIRNLDDNGAPSVATDATGNCCKNSNIFSCVNFSNTVGRNKTSQHQQRPLRTPPATTAACLDPSSSQPIFPAPTSLTTSAKVPPATALPFPPMRLNRLLAHSGFCSRRKADKYIIAGKVKVNGQTVVTPGIMVTADASVEVNGSPISAPPPLTYLLINKPIHTVCTSHDPQGRPTVLDLIPSPLRSLRLYPVGRLDYFSEGLLLLTNDGELTLRLTHPRFQHVKTYEVLVRGHVPASALQAMRAGMTIAANPQPSHSRAAKKGSIKLLPAQVRAESLPDGNTLLLLELRQGINRQIRKMCAALDLTILRLRRIALGCLKLGNLPVGKMRPLSQEEIAALRKMAALKK